MNGSSGGVGGLVYLAAWAENTLGMEVLSIGRSADNQREDCVLEITSRWLAYRLALRGGWVWLSIALMDKGDEPELLLNVGDGEVGFRTLRSLILAFERQGEIKSLERPIELGDENDGPRSWVIS
jgi:hypothetical protein